MTQSTFGKTFLISLVLHAGLLGAVLWLASRAPVLPQAPLRIRIIEPPPVAPGQETRGAPAEKPAPLEIPGKGTQAGRQPLPTERVAPPRRAARVPEVQGSRQAKPSPIEGPGKNAGAPKGSVPAEVMRPATPPSAGQPVPSQQLAMRSTAPPAAPAAPKVTAPAPPPLTAPPRTGRGRRRRRRHRQPRPIRAVSGWEGPRQPGSSRRRLRHRPRARPAGGPRSASKSTSSARGSRRTQAARPSRPWTWTAGIRCMSPIWPR